MKYKNYGMDSITVFNLFIKIAMCFLCWAIEPALSPTVSSDEMLCQCEIVCQIAIC